MLIRLKVNHCLLLLSIILLRTLKEVKKQRVTPLLELVS